MNGVVYLLHFDTPYAHARHYLGFSTDLEARLAEHARGSGARLMAVVADAGISWRLVRTWEGGRDVERRLKNTGSGARLCPLCSPRLHWGAFAPSTIHAVPPELAVA